MIYVTEREDTAVAVIVPSGALARFVMFEMSLEGLFVPKDSDLMRGMSDNPARGKNGAVQDALGSRAPHFTHFFFVDDDHTFDNAVLIHLLSRKVPMVCALTNWKTPPFAPMVFSGENPEDAGGRRTLMTYPLDQLDGVRGVVPVYAAAGSGLLVERRVFEAVQPPWFVVGKFSPDELSEDLYFYEQARDAGFNPHVDFDVSLGHCSVSAVRLVRDSRGVWAYEIMWPNGKKIVVGR